MKAKKNTGIFVTPEERHHVVQLFGKATAQPSPENRDELNRYMQLLAMKYDYEDYWLFSEIEPITGEVILSKEECCDEHEKKVSEE